MRKKLMLLDELQEIDLRIDSFKGDTEALQGEIAALESQITDAQNEIAVKAEGQETINTERQSLEETIANETDNIVRSEARLKEIKTQKEYQAVSKEITTAKKLKAELEDQLLQKIGLLDELKTEIAERQEKLQLLTQNIGTQKAALEEKISRLEQDIHKDVAAREETAKGLPASVLKRYGMLREQRRGLAVVEARDGSCLGCNMNLPPQLYNSLFRGDELITCPHCQRMLVLRQEVSAG